MEISNKLDDAENKIFAIEDSIRESEKSQEEITKSQRALRDTRLQYLNIWEYFSFLVNNGEIKDKKVINYFKQDLISGTQNLFKKYPDIERNEKAFPDIRNY